MKKLKRGFGRSSRGGLKTHFYLMETDKELILDSDIEWFYLNNRNEKMVKTWYRYIKRKKVNND